VVHRIAIAAATTATAAASAGPLPPYVAEPPEGAQVLFDGTDASRWVAVEDGAECPWKVEDGALVAVPGAGSVMTDTEFESFWLHLEFRVPPSQDGATGQGRGNSGVYIQRRYEVQILDSFGLETLPNGCAALYGQRAPDSNQSRRPGEWQSYLIDFTPPQWAENGDKQTDARISVWHNDVLVHDDAELPTKTGQGAPEGPEPGPILLQDHGHAVAFRNIWILPKPVAWEGPKGPGFQPLFDGETLDDWTQRGGEAVYKAEDGVIVGETRPHQPNSFLCSNLHFSDFILELRFKVDRELNSGIQIRSNSMPDVKNGRVHGYQVEIDPSDRAWSAGIYDESRRGWLNDLKENEPARRAFRQDQWNRLRVVAIGDSFRTYLNGVPAADLVDDMTASGFIGLQVHGVGGREDPLNVRWRDIRVRALKPPTRPEPDE
jgi:hypothetical protein